jgi:hypothetical protein
MKSASANMATKDVWLTKPRNVDPCTGSYLVLVPEYGVIRLVSTKRKQ